MRWVWCELHLSSSDGESLRLTFSPEDGRIDYDYREEIGHRHSQLAEVHQQIVDLGGAVPPTASVDEDHRYLSMLSANVPSPSIRN